MRKTRSSSVSDFAPGGKRSLRSAHNDEFYEIPTKFKYKNSTRHEPKLPEKLTPTRRSSRLSGDDIELKDLGFRPRNRRLHSLPEVANSSCPREPKNGSLQTPKGVKKEGQSIESPIQNGICGRTRQRNVKRELLSNSLTPRRMSDSLAPRKSPLSVSCLESLKRTRFSPRSKRLSFGEKPSQTSEVQWALSTTELKQKLLNGGHDPYGNAANVETPAKSDDGLLSICSCDPGTKSRQSKIDHGMCEFCGKLTKKRKNGCISNGPLNRIVSRPRFLRSSGRETAISHCTHSTALEKGTAKQHDGDESTPKCSGPSSSNSSPHPSEAVCTEELQSSPEKQMENLEKLATASESSPPNASDTIDKQPDENAASLATRVPDSNNNTNTENDDSDRKSEEKPMLNGIDANQESVNSPLLIDEFDCMNLDLLDEGDDDCSLYTRKKRKMNLRSSGVRCDPDFYTLSLGLMIKRPRHCRLSNDVVDGSMVEEKPEAADKVESNSSEILQAENIQSKTDPPELPPTKKVEPEPRAVDDDSAEKEALAVNAASPHFSSTPRKSTPRKVHPRTKASKPQKVAVDEKLEKSPTIRIITKDPDEPPPLFAEEPPHGSDVYYFESDHVALKHDKDYHRLLSTASVLEAQRCQCLDDIKVLEAKKNEALNAPVEFVEKLQGKVPMDIPCQQDVPGIPDIDWSKYSSVYGTFDHVFSREETSPKKPVTRKVKINFKTGVPLQSTDKLIKNKGTAEASRSETFRVAWSVEEQRKLEDLLIKYPSEEIVFNRYRKIAAELENRTPLQVQSRCQKYFIKLAKAGLPVPGHMPRLFRHKEPGSVNRSKRAKTHPQQSLARISTFFPTFHCPVRMADGEGQSTPNDEEENGWTVEQDQISDEEDVPDNMRFSDEYLEILRLKRIRREKLRVFDRNGQQALAQHVGYECDMCNCDPIQGVRYHCIDCPTEQCIDLCQSCIRWQGQFETERHKVTHRMEPVYKAENFVDDDYMKFVSRSGEYNYLDPNFLPPAT